MLPVMLDRVGILTLIIVVLGLACMIPVLSSAKSQVGMSSDSGDLAVRATKSSERNFNLSLLNGGDKKSPVRRGQKSGAGFSAGFRNNSGMLVDVTGQQFLVENGTFVGGSINRKRQQKKANAKEVSVAVEGSSLWPEDIQIGCKELRARRYISDGFCTSEEPIKEVACAGQCLPIMDMPWYAEFVKTIAKSKLKDWQCVEDVVRKKRIKLLCQNGSSKFYRIKVVESCKCKKITNKHNRTSQKKKKRKDKKSKPTTDHDRV